MSPRLSERGKVSEPGAAPCLVVDCKTLIPIDALFCARHRALVWDDTYDWLYAKFRPGVKQSKVFRRRLDVVRKEIEDGEFYGGKAPREQTLFVR
jgi:hypothetical protein